VLAGSVPSIDTLAIQSSVRNASVAEVRLVPRVLDPDPNHIPEGLVAALGPHARIANSKWAQLRPIDRYVLATLALNTRLLFRALREIMPEDTATEQPWKAAVAHVEVSMRPDTLDKLRNAGFLDGRAFVLARVAGVRAARRAQETFDLRSERATGMIELDWAPLDEPGAVVWQAHVSSWDGGFFAAASLVAASTAAVALADMVAEDDKSVTITSVKIEEEPWVVGSDQRDQPTTVFAGREVRASLAAAPRNTARMNNPGDTASKVSLPPGVREGASSQRPSAGETAKQRAVSANDALRELTQNSVLLWVVFGMLTVMLAAVIGIILALVNMRR
ncbi:MAG: cyclic pyranopterin monophosphate synthase MoaC, partial [Polyangiaceae bacterium]